MAGFNCTRFLWDFTLKNADMTKNVIAHPELQKAAFGSPVMVSVGCLIPPAVFARQGLAQSSAGRVYTVATLTSQRVADAGGNTTIVVAVEL